MRCFRRSDAQQNSQHFHIRDPLRQRWIKAGAALFDGREVEDGGIDDGLQKVGIAGVRIGTRNRGVLTFMQIGHGLGKNEAGIEVRIMRAVTIPRVPTGIEGQLHQIGEP